MTIVYLLLGANLGDRFAQVSIALQNVERDVGAVVSKSSLYETEAWGGENQPMYLNQVLIVETTLSARALLEAVQKIENQLGRTRKEKWESRLIDIDILFYGDECISEPDLIVPHPFLDKRKFTLVPLVEIAADLIHPVHKKTVRQLLSELDDPLTVLKVTKRP
jgi:2-amino-4-hydroxy-6-hydroxymethyldihydropteridine diphosphokinase